MHHAPILAVSSEISFISMAMECLAVLYLQGKGD